MLWPWSQTGVPREAQGMAGCPLTGVCLPALPAPWGCCCGSAQSVGTELSGEGFAAFTASSVSAEAAGQQLGQTWAVPPGSEPARGWLAVPMCLGQGQHWGLCRSQAEQSSPALQSSLLKGMAGQVELEPPLARALCQGPWQQGAGQGWHKD